MERMTQRTTARFSVSIKGNRTFLIQLSGRKQQSKHTRKHEEGPQYHHLLQVQAEGTLCKKMRRKEYYKME
jgi:hypothetical protein